MIRIRDLIVAMTAVAVMITTLVVFNDRLRQSVHSLSTSVADARSNGSVGAFGEAASGVVAVITDFAASNPFLSAFLVVAIVLVILAMRI